MTVHPFPRDLRHRLRAGDADALAELLARHWDAVLRYVAGLVEDPDDGADVAQEAFVRLWRGRGRLTKGGSLEALLFKIAHNGARDLKRRRRVRERWAGAAAHIEREASPPRDLAEADELQCAAERAVAALSPRRREVFLLIRTSGLTHREAAGVLGVSPQTVANLMSRALDDLRAALAPYLT